MKVANAKILAVIPAFNEEESLPITLAELRKTRPEIDILVVDDGSLDKTAEVGRAAGVIVVSLPVNLGIGGAVQTGLHYADRNGYDIALQCAGAGSPSALRRRVPATSSSTTQDRVQSYDTEE